MALFKEKKKRIFNTGKNLGEPTPIQEGRLISDWHNIVPPIIENHTRRNKNIIYGGRAVNAKVGPDFSRQSHDYDIYSKFPKRHAIQIEKRIDRKIGADVAHVEEVAFDNRDGKSGKMYRVVTKPYGDPDVDYNLMPSSIEFETINGIRYETLGKAEEKYKKMIREGEEKRYYKARLDLQRIQMSKIFKKLERGF